MSSHEDNKLATSPMGKLVVALFLPAVVAQVVNVLYNIVDRIYIGHIPGTGTIALTGVGICLPILMLITAFSSFVGMGGAPLAAIQLGKGNPKEAEKILGNGVTLLITFSIILTTFFMLFKTPLLYAFGGSKDTITYATDYLTIYLCGTLFVQIAVGLNTFITCQGQSKIAMISVLIGAIINIILDPIFIFGLNLGVKGAALATIISQACSAIWIIRFLISDKSSIRIRLNLLKPNRAIMLSIGSLGISSFIMQSTESLINIVFNSGLQTYGGDLYVGSMTILQSVMMLFTTPIFGVVQGIQPIISYNYGAKNLDRVKQAFKYSLAICFTATTVCGVSAMLFPTVFCRLFTSEPEMLALLKQVMPIFMGGVWLFGIQFSCQYALMGMGQAKLSLFLALLRKIILLIPLALILPMQMGVMGIYWAEPIADIIAVLTTGILFAISFKKILKQANVS